MFLIVLAILFVMGLFFVSFIYLPEESKEIKRELKEYEKQKKLKK